MIPSIPQIDISFKTPQPSDKPQTQDVKQADGFGSMLRKAQKAKDRADQSDASRKTEDDGDGAGKTEKDGEKLFGSAASAAPQEVPLQIPVPIHPDVPAAQAAAQTPVLPAVPVAAAQTPVLPAVPVAAAQTPVLLTVPSDNAQTAPEADARAMQISAPKAVLQIPENRTGRADFENQLPEATDAAFKMETVPPQTKSEAAGISETETILPQAESELPQSTDVRAAASTSFSTPRQTAVSAKPAGTADSPASVRLSTTLAQDVPKIASAEEAKLQTLRHTPQRSADAPPKTPLFSGIYSGFSGGKVIVKVSDAASQAVPTVGSQLCSAVSDGLKGGKRQLQVDLYPQSLGKVSVSLASENGVLTVEIAAANPKTQSLLASSSSEISSMLRASTGQAVQVTAGQQAQQQFAGQNGGSAQQEAARQQQQQEEARKYRAAQWYAAENSAGFSTKDFLTALHSAAV